ncbi:hypothetical protein EDD16DRAFT_1714006 [Pisolithus croceorrhizus]|nr:hypothetical protein EV401DRAFT_2080839 [Pisolithus croceorrhizus]KAI6105211.1 hypothetical protein EDD16DRAFT_1714006 [Pisolithus croceorrhizus]KAI6169167.1 hypothetical protein EDD17DRAFT_1749671 [Pisolithus thermaeus]
MPGLEGQGSIRSVSPDAGIHTAFLPVSRVSDLLIPLTGANFSRLMNADPGPKKPSILKFYCSHIEHLKHPPALRTLQEWLAAGAKFTQIAAGGTIYSLLILSGLGLRSAVGRAHGLVHSDVASMLRHPQTIGAELSQLIQQRVIPTVARMREELPLRLDIGGTLLDCTSLRESDLALGRLQTKELKLPSRSSSAWQICSPVYPEDGQYLSISRIVSSYLVPSATSDSTSAIPAMPDTQPLQALLAPPNFNIDIIKTTYSRFHPTNTYFSA